MANSPTSPLRQLAADPVVRRRLGLSAALSLLGLGATVAAFILIARAVTGALLGGALPEIRVLAVIAALLLVRALGRAGREWVGQGLAAQSV